MNAGRAAALAAVLCLASGSSGAQNSQQATQAQPAPSIQSPTATLKKTVGLLRVGFSQNGVAMVASGTCFFVVYQDKRLSEGRGFIYLVTNRHVAMPGIEDGHPYPILWTTIRLNQRGAEQTSADVPLGTNVHWYFPPDDSTDLAVIPVIPDQSKYDLLAIPTSIFATRDVVKQFNVSEGDSVLFTGYFYQFPGTEKFEPILRQGILAMMPDEKMETTLRKPGDIYLAEVHVFGGNSGSPLMVNLGGLRNGGLTTGPNYKLLGIVSGYYHEDMDLTLTVATTLRGTLEQNSGISLVVPVDKLKELLDDPALQAARDASVAAETKK